MKTTGPGNCRVPSSFSSSRFITTIVVKTPKRKLCGVLYTLWDTHISLQLVWLALKTTNLIAVFRDEYCVWVLAGPCWLSFFKICLFFGWVSHNIHVLSLHISCQNNVAKRESTIYGWVFQFPTKTVSRHKWLKNDPYSQFIYP